MTEMQQCRLLLSVCFLGLLFTGFKPETSLGVFMFILTGAFFVFTLFEFAFYFFKKGLSKTIKWVKGQ